jgi:DNA-binding GntR family transcriptional regulator
MARTPALPTSNGTETRATSLYDRLRTDLLRGALEPGSRLAIDALAAHYATSTTPLREALNRLVADGLVERREQRGFAVASVSAADLAEITKARCQLEELALRESIAARTQAWEDTVALAYHRLSRTPRSLSKTRFDDNPDWEPRHRAFHRALIAGCGSRWLISFCDQLADQHQRYRRLSAARAYRTRPVANEHLAILNAAIEGRADEAVALLRAHIQRTGAILMADPTLFEPK